MNPLTLLRSTAPHAGLAGLSAELWAAYERLPRSHRVALAVRDECPRTGEDALTPAIAVELCKGRAWSKGRAWWDAIRLARDALRETRGILSPDGKVTR